MEGSALGPPVPKPLVSKALVKVESCSRLENMRQYAHLRTTKIVVPCNRHRVTRHWLTTLNGKAVSCEQGIKEHPWRCQMSIHVMSRIMRDRTYDGKQKLILLAIADMVDKNGVGFASYRQIQEVTDVSTVYLRKCIQQFVSEGRLQIVSKGSGKGRATVYRVLVEQGNSVPENSVLENYDIPNCVTPEANCVTPPSSPPSFTSLETSSVLVGESSSPSINTLAQEITKAYTDRVPLSKFVAVMAIVKRALATNLYTPEQITDALTTLADEGRPVTVDSLRIALEGSPARKDKWRAAMENIKKGSEYREAGGAFF